MLRTDEKLEMTVDRDPISHTLSIDDEIRRLRRFQASFARLFTMIAEMLPNLATRLAALVARINTEADPDSANSILPSLKQVLATGEQFRNEITLVSSLNQQMAPATQALGARIEALIDSIGGINRSSAVLGYTAINASVAAARLGDIGAAFGVLTGELGRQAEHAVRQATKIRTSSAQVLRVSSDLERLRCGLESSFESLANMQSVKADKAIQALIASVHSFTTNLLETGNRAAKALSAIRNVMNSIQRQDILRQGIDHVTIVLQEVNAPWTLDHDETELLAFRSQVGSLAAELIGDIRKDLTILASEILSEFSALKETTERLVVSQNEAARELAARLEDEANTSKASTESVRQAVAVFVEYQQANDDLHRFVLDLAPSLSELEEVAGYLRTVDTLIKIEVSRSDNMMKASTIALQVTSTRQNLEQLVTVAVERKVQLAEHLEEVQGALLNVSARRHTLVSASESAHNQSHKTRAEATRYMSEIASLAAEARSVAGLTGTFTVSLKTFLDSVTALSATQDSCTRMANQAQDQLALMGIDSTELATTGRLKELVQQFTIVSHKEVAAGVVDFEVERGDDGGTLTLF